MMQLEAPHTPPSQMLPPDTVVLADFRRYLRVPFDSLVKCVGAMPSQQDLQRIRNNLTESKILTDDESGLRWTDFTPPATSKGSEEDVFKPLGCIIAPILAEFPNRGVFFVGNPNLTPLSQRNNTSRPDGYLVLNNEKTQRKIHWLDIAVPFEFKKVRDIGSLRDDEEKIVWSLHSIMREDLLRRFAFGITIEDTQLRLWLSNRAFLAVTEPIDLFQNIDGVISLFYALGSAPVSSAMKELGWDPTVEQIRDGEGFQYKFTIGDEVFTTRESHLPSTGGVPDSGRPSTCFPIKLGNIARKDTGIPRRVHTRTIFHDVGVALNNITSLADILSCLSGALQALRYMHKAGWVHRDFSVGNAIWFGGMGKLSDFEYAKKIDSNTSHDVRTGTMRFMAVEAESEIYLFLTRHARRLDDRSSLRMNFLHDIESIWWVFTWILFYHTDTNTANADHSFDAHAQLKEYYLAFPGTVGRTSRRDFFLDAGQLQTKLENILSKTCFNVWSPIIPDFADALQDSYQKAEANFPLLALDDALLDDIHTKAAAYLDDAQRRASGIELCPLSNLLKQKRPRPGDETSLPPNNQGKKARNA